MAKKKLSDYQKARREFVQRRAATVSGDVTKEQKQQFRQRFDVLASTKQGRTQLAQRALPTGGPEERRDYKRMLATELPARGSTNTGPKTKVLTYSDYAERLSAAQSSIPKRSTTPGVSPAPKKMSMNVRGGVGSAQYGPQYTPSKSNVQKAQDLFSNRRNNIIGKGIDFPGRAAFDRITNPLGGTGKVEFTAKGVGKAALQELGEAALVAGPMARGAATGLSATKKVLQFGLKKVGQTFFQQAKNTKPPKTSKPSSPKPSKPSAPKPPKPSGAKTPGRKLPSTKTSSTKTSKGKGPSIKDVVAYEKTQPGPRSRSMSDLDISAKEVEDLTMSPGALPKGPKRPTGTKKPSTKTPSTKTPSTKTPGRKLPDTKPASTKTEKVSKTDAEDVVYQAAQTKNRFPGATDKDKSFIDKLNRAQQAIENKSAGYQAYANWLKNPQTQATLARLRRK